MLAHEIDDLLIDHSHRFDRRLRLAAANVTTCHVDALESLAEWEQEPLCETTLVFRRIAGGEPERSLASALRQFAHGLAIQPHANRSPIVGTLATRALGAHP